MSGNSQHLSELFIIFIIAFLSIVVSFLCIDVFFFFGGVVDNR